MYVCICICIHVNVCHVCIVCHVYIHTCVYLVRVDLDIILLVVSDRDDSAKGWKSLFENVGVFEVYEHHDFFVHSEHETEESVKTEGSLGGKCFFGEKKSSFRTEGS